MTRMRSRVKDLGSVFVVRRGNKVSNDELVALERLNDKQW